MLEHCGKELATWVGFVNPTRFNVPPDAAAETCRVTRQTAWEWRHRIFAAVDGHQGRIVPRDGVWIDEAYVNDTDLAHGCGEARRRGLSRQEPCMAVAIDVHENPVAVACGHGRPSAKRIRDGLQSHMAKGPTIVGDKERSHDSLVRAVRGTHEAYRADVGDPVCLERMSLVNNPCPWLKRHLWRFTGMDPKSLQSCLSWYVYLFRVNQARDRWPETERVVRHLLMTDARFHGST